MAVNNIASTTTAVFATANGDLNILLDGNFIAVDDQTGFQFSSFTNNELRVDGRIISTSAGIISQSAVGNQVTIGQTGAVIAGSNSGIFLGGNNAQVSNRGEVSSETASGVFLGGDDASLFNSGTISGLRGVAGRSDIFEFTNTGTVSGNTGVSITSDSSTMVNSGDVFGTDFAISYELTADEGASLVNTGLVASSGAAIMSLGEGRVEISNSGQISGLLDLGAGNDLIDSRNGEITGRVLAGGGDDTVILGSEDNFVDGRAGADMIRGGGGNDEIQGGSGADELRGGAGDDDIIGEDSNDEVYGGHGDDNLRGNVGADRLFGGTGNDVLAGGSGDDRMNGGRDDDVLTGNGGEDLFIFNRQAGNDEITDFNDGVDRIDLRAFNVTASDVLAATSVVGLNSVIDLDALGGAGSIVIEDDTSMGAADFLV